ncbi:MAG: AAA family ATPase [Actinomycetota bacterium]|nr:AAA family ATPase [Actinomycetota bacterium]
MNPRDGDRPLLGRDAELERLRPVWHRARRGHRQVILLSGEPGVGKTALATRLAAEAEVGGAAVLTGCAEEGQSRPYQPVADALRGAMGGGAVGFLDRGRVLGFVLPELGRPTPPPATPAGVPGTDREELFDAVGELVTELTRPGPVVLVVDDLHRADRSTVLLLDRIVDATRGSRLLVIACYCDTSVDRVHPLTALLDDLDDDVDVTRVRLEGLAPEAVAAMVGDPELADALARRGEGNPLFIHELLRELRRTGHLRSDGTLDPSADVDADLLPRSIEDLLNRRTARLKPATRRLLGVAAVAARPVDLELVAATEEVRAERLSGAVAEAVDSGLLEKADVDGGRYRFTHAVARRTVYRRLTKSALVRLHLRVAEVLAAAGRESTDGCRLAEIASHFCAASPVGHSEEAARYAAAAGDQAMAVLAYEAAADLYGRALALLGLSASSSWVTRCDLLLSLGEAQRQALEPARARQAFLEAITVAEGHNHTQLVARARRALAGAGCDADSPETVAGPVADDRAIETVAGRGDHLAVGALLRARHMRAWGAEDLDERLRAANDAVRMAEQTGDAGLAAQGYAWRLVDLLELGRLADADRDLAAHAALAETLRDPAVERDAALLSSMRALLDGRAADARARLGDVLEAGERAKDPLATVLHLRQRYWLDIEWGGEPEHTALLRAARRMAPGADPAGAWGAAASLVLARTGHLSGAAMALSRVSRHGLTARPHGPAWMAAAACVAESAWLLADPRWTPVLAPALEPFSGRLVVLEQGAACLGSVARLQALLAAGARRWAEAGRLFEEALEVHGRLGALPLVARTSYELGATLLRRGRRGDVGRAQTWLRRGAELGMRQLSDDASIRLRSA